MPRAPPQQKASSAESPGVAARAKGDEMLGLLAITAHRAVLGEEVQGLGLDGVKAEALAHGETGAGDPGPLLSVS